MVLCQRCPLRSRPPIPRVKKQRRGDNNMQHTRSDLSPVVALLEIISYAHNYAHVHAFLVPSLTLNALFTPIPPDLHPIPQPRRENLRRKPPQLHWLIHVTLLPELNIHPRRSRVPYRGQACETVETPHPRRGPEIPSSLPSSSSLVSLGRR